MSSNIKAIKSGIWYTASNFLVKSVGFITTPIFTRLLTKKEFGIYNNYLSWLSIIAIFVTLHLDSTLISAKYDFKDKFDEYILSVLTLSTISAVAWILIFNFNSNSVSAFLGLDNTYVNAMLLYLLFSPAVGMFQSREQFSFEYRKTVITGILSSVGTAILSVILVFVLDNRLTGRVLGGVIPTIILGFCFYVYFIKIGKKIKIFYWKYALPICLPYIPHLLSMTLLNSTDRVMISKWCNAEDTAMYSLAYTCGTMVTLFLTSLNNAFAPWLGEKLDTNSFDEVREFSKFYISGFLFFSIGIMLIAPEMLYILGGNSYMEAKYVMTPVAMGCVCQFLYTMFVNIEQFKKKTLGMAFASLIAALINIILNIIFIPKVGYLAAAYTTLIGYICLLSMHMLLVYHLGFSKVYNYRYVLSILGIGLISTIIITILYEYNAIRYSFWCIYIIFAVYIVKKNKDILFRFIGRRR